MASPMLQEIFGGALVGHPKISFNDLNDDQLVKVAANAFHKADAMILLEQELKHGRSEAPRVWSTE